MSDVKLRTAVVGGGAAGCFLAIRLKELMPSMDVEIFERQHRLLAKVEISGGGRCNCTNSFEGVSDFRQVYPRGGRLLSRLFRRFSHEDAFRWFENHGVPLVVQDDNCVFPKAQDSHAIIDCFLSEMRRLGVVVHLGMDGFSCLFGNGGADSYDFVAVTTGGMHGRALDVFRPEFIEPPLPSLFTFNIDDAELKGLMGTVVEDVCVSVPGTRMRGEGALLITHWGMSGPAILKLSSHAARVLAENNYRMPLAVDWSGGEGAECVRDCLLSLAADNAQRLVANTSPTYIPSRLWLYLTGKAGIDASVRRWKEVGSRQMNRLVEVITNDRYDIAGRCHHKEEFVTCGGISLKAVDCNTLEGRPDILVSPVSSRLFFAGEVLDIDGVTGGFNLQAAWTTAFVAAEEIVNAVR